MRRGRTQAHENIEPCKLPDIGVGIGIAIGSLLIDPDTDSDPEVFCHLYLFSKQSLMRRGAPYDA